MLPSLFSISNLLTLFPVEERGIFYALHGSIQGTHHVYVSRLLQNCYPQCSYYFYPMKQMSELDIYPDFKPNATTIAALPETLKNRDSFTAHTYPVCPVYSSHKYSRPADHRLARRIPPEYPWDFPRKDWYSFYPCYNNRPDISMHFLWE